MTPQKNNHISIERKLFKKERRCYMCGAKIKSVVIIFSSLHGFILCHECIIDLKDAIDDAALEEPI